MTDRDDPLVLPELDSSLRTVDDRTPSAERNGDTIGLVPERGTLTYADLAAVPDDGLRRELLGGELVVSPSPLVRHQDVVVELLVQLRAHVKEHGLGRVFVAPLDVLLSDNDVVEPDIVFVAAWQRDIIAEKNIVGVPALLVEVVSDSRVDRVRKRDVYERFGVREYWVVDADADRIEVHRLQDGRYGKPEFFAPGDVLETPEIPGLRLDLAAVFAR